MSGTGVASQPIFVRRSKFDWTLARFSNVCIESLCGGAVAVTLFEVFDGLYNSGALLYGRLWVEGFWSLIGILSCLVFLAVLVARRWGRDAVAPIRALGLLHDTPRGVAVALPAEKVALLAAEEGFGPASGYRFPVAGFVVRGDRKQYFVLSATRYDKGASAVIIEASGPSGTPDACWIGATSKAVEYADGLLVVFSVLTQRVAFSGGLWFLCPAVALVAWTVARPYLARRAPLDAKIATLLRPMAPAADAAGKTAAIE